MNIALLSIVPLNYFKEATTLTILNLAKELKLQGHNVVIITERKRGLKKYENIQGISVYRLFALGKILSHGLALRKISKNLGLKFDIINSFSSTPLFALSGAFAKLFFPKAKLIHSMKSYSRRGYDKFLFPLLNISNKITVPTMEFKNKIKYVNKKKIKVTYSPINIKKFYPQDKELLKQKHGFTGEKVILYYGSFHEHKGADNLFYAIPEVIKDMKNVMFIFAPRYSQIPHERNLVKKLNIEENVHFHVEDIPIEEFVNLADAVVLPYNSMVATEGNPSCILESMACKTPVITANLPELKETFNGDVIMTDVRNSSNLAKHIKMVLNQKNEKMIEQAYKKTQKFSSENIAKAMLKLYQE